MTKKNEPAAPVEPAGEATPKGKEIVLTAVAEDALAIADFLRARLLLRASQVDDLAGKLAMSSRIIGEMQKGGDNGAE